MSGPKISVYSLTGRARKIVMEQMRCEQQALVCAGQIKAMLSEMCGAEQRMEKSLDMLTSLQKRNGGREKIIEEIRSLRDRIDVEIKEIENDFKKNIPAASARYRITDEALARKQRELEQIKTVRDRLRKLHDEASRAENAGSEAVKSERGKAQQTIADYLSGGQNSSPADTQEEDPKKRKSDIADAVSGIMFFEPDGSLAGDTDFDIRKNALQQKLSELLKQEPPRELAGEINAALARLDRIDGRAYLDTFESLTVRKIIGNMEAYHKERKEEEAESEELTARYRTLCLMADREADKDRRFAAREELEAAVNELEMLLVKRQEQSYIADCVDEIMTDMGYDLIGRRNMKKRSGKQFRNELYRFGEGTAVNVTYSPDGRISMEVGGIAREDRIPDDAEISALTGEMEAFCGEFAEFERRMREKGILTDRRVALMPPAPEYASIINISDYETEKGRQISEFRASSGKGKRKETVKQTLRREE